MCKIMRQKMANVSKSTQRTSLAKKHYGFHPLKVFRMGVLYSVHSVQCAVCSTWGVKSLLGHFDRAISTLQALTHTLAGLSVNLPWLQKKSSREGFRNFHQRFPKNDFHKYLKKNRKGHAGRCEKRSRKRFARLDKKVRFKLKVQKI